jgi:hypothetical protein
MAECCSASGYEDLFNAKEAEKSLRSYEKDGLDETGRALVDT